MNEISRLSGRVDRTIAKGDEKFRSYIFLCMYVSFQINTTRRAFINSIS